MKRPISFFSYRTCAILAAVGASIVAQAYGQPKATAPYKLSVFANAPSGLSAPDSLAAEGAYVFVGYGDGHAPDGSDGLNSQVVQYTMNGHVVHTYTVTGHNDGIKIDPQTHLVWAMQNEDLNPNLVIINPETFQQMTYSFGPTPHGGGYDDIVFKGCSVYISASNPANNPNNGPAIVTATLNGAMVDVAPLLAGEAEATDIKTDSTVKLNLQDPDSMTLDPQGNIVLDSQGDQQLIIVTDPGLDTQQAIRIPLTYETSKGLTSVEVDDTNFTTSAQGFILIADKSLNQVFKLTRNAFVPGVAYTAADGAQLVGTLDMSTGVITPIVTGLSNPGGLIFVDTAHQVFPAYAPFGTNPCQSQN